MYQMRWGVYIYIYFSCNEPDFGRAGGQLRLLGCGAELLASSPELGSRSPLGFGLISAWLVLNELGLPSGSLG